MIFFLVSTSSIDSLIIGRNLPTMVCLFYLLVLSLCIYFLYLYDDIWKPRTRNLKMETISKILNCRIRRGLKLKHWEFICVEVLIPSIYLEFHVLIKKLIAFIQGEIYMMHEIRHVCVCVGCVGVFVRASGYLYGIIMFKSGRYSVCQFFCISWRRFVSNAFTVECKSCS